MSNSADSVFHSTERAFFLRYRRIVSAAWLLLTSVGVYSDEKSNPAIAAGSLQPPAQNASEIAGAEPGGEKDIQRKFDLYLDCPQIAQLRIDQYRNLIAQALASIKVGDDHHARNLLNALASYPELDGGFSEQVGKRIDAIVEINRIKARIEESDRQLQQSMDQPDKSGEEIGDIVRKQKQEQDRGLQGDGAESNMGSLPENPPDSPGEGPIVAPAPEGISEVPELTQDYLKSVATRSKIEADQKNNEMLLEESRQEYLLFIKDLYELRRYHQVALASEFYPKLFGFGRCPPETQNEVQESLQSNLEISEGIRSIQDDWNNGYVDQAGSALRRIYLISDVDPQILGVSLELKNRIKLLNSRVAKVQKMIQERQFIGFHEIFAEISKDAPDMDLEGEKQTIELDERNSQKLTNQGKSEIYQGDFVDALKDLRAAQGQWADNPDLKDGAEQIIAAGESRQKTLATFDQLFLTQDYSAIKKDRSEFINTLNDDSQREKNFESALKIASDAETQLEKAKTMQSAGNMAGAWETVSLLSEEWPTNSELTSQKEKLARGAANFVLALEKARNYEGQRALGPSLSWYAIAQSHYPASELARQGISRMTILILAK